ncbi:hypothetical protein Bbelb_170150 [Branchiostoma belcheri]|nr:hypothetical protein Bbelb_170150 [Branchiostoma belcheri]
MLLPAAAKAWAGLAPRKPVRSHSADAARTPRKPAASKLRKEVRAASLTRLDDVKDGVVSTKEILSSLLDASAVSAKAWAGLTPKKPPRALDLSKSPLALQESLQPPNHGKLQLHAPCRYPRLDDVASRCGGTYTTRGAHEVPLHGSWLYRCGILKKEKTGRARSLAPVPAAVQPRRARARVNPVKPADLLKILCLGDGTGKARITRKRQQVDTATAKPLADAAARATEGTPVLQPPTKPSRFVEGVRAPKNNFGHFGFSLLTTLTPDLERVHIVFQLPTASMSCQGKTTEEIYNIFNRSPESVRLKILPLYFPLPVLQEMVSDQVSPVTYQDHMEYFVSQGRVNPVKKSTLVSRLVKDYEALSSRTGPEHAAAAVMTPVRALPDADQVMLSRRSVRDMKLEIEARICPAPSDPSVVVGVTPVRILALPETDQGMLTRRSVRDMKLEIEARCKPTPSIGKPQKTVGTIQPTQPELVGDSAGATTDPAAGDLLREVVDKVTLKAQKPGRSRSSSLPPTPKSAGVKQGRSRSLSRLDDVTADFLKSDLLPTLKKVVLKAEKPYRSRSLPPTPKSTGGKLRKESRSRSLSRLDDVTADFLKSDLLPTRSDVAGKSTPSVYPSVKLQKPGRAQSADGARAPRKPAASKLRKEVRAASLTRLDDVKAGVVSPQEILSSLLDAAAAAKAWAGLAPRKPVRSHSADAARTPRKPAASKLRKEVRAASLTRLDDVKAGVVSTKEILSSFLDAASAAKARLAARAARKPSTSKPRKAAVARALSLSRLDDLAPDVGVRIQQEELMRSLCMGRASTKASVILKKEKKGRSRSLAPVTAVVQSCRARARSLSVTRIKAKRGEPVKPADLLKTLCLGHGTGKARITQKRQQVDTASTKPLADAAARAPEGTPVLQPPTKPSWFKEYVLYRNNFGHFGFSLLTTLTPDLERVHIVFQAADSIDVLPVGRLLAVNFLPVQGKTTEELYGIFNRSPESVRLKILPLYFPLPVLQEMVSDQVSPVTYKDHIEYFVSQGRVNPVKKWVKKRLRRISSALSRCRNAFTCCWGR